MEIRIVSITPAHGWANLYAADPGRYHTEPMPGWLAVEPVAEGPDAREIVPGVLDDEDRQIIPAAWLYGFVAAIPENTPPAEVLDRVRQWHADRNAGWTA